MSFRHYQNAKKEGRLCVYCGWFVSKKRWEAGHRACEHCEDARLGVNVTSGAFSPRDEPEEPTGENYEV